MKLRDQWTATVCAVLLLATLAVAQSTNNATSLAPVPRLVKYTGVAKDEAAVRATIALPWSNGPPEGQITRLSSSDVKCAVMGRSICFKPS